MISLCLRFRETLKGLKPRERKGVFKVAESKRVRGAEATVASAAFAALGTGAKAC